MKKADATLKEETTTGLHPIPFSLSFRKRGGALHKRGLVMLTSRRADVLYNKTLNLNLLLTHDNTASDCLNLVAILLTFLGELASARFECHFTKILTTNSLIP